jgi:hypothetical protein
MSYLFATQKKKEKFVVLQCDHRGCYRDTRHVLENKQKRGTTSRLINCPFKISSKKRDDSS